MFEENEFDSRSLIERFEEMISSNSTTYFDVDELEEIVEYYTEMGMNAKAYRAIEVGNSLHPGAAGLKIRFAQVLAEDDKMEEALSELDTAEMLEPNNADLFIARASILSKQGHHNRAVKSLLEGLGKSTDPLDFFPLIAAEYQLLGKFEEAIRFYKLTLEEDPEDEMALYNMAICFDMLDMNKKAAEFFLHYIDKNPYTEIAWYYLGVVYNKMRDFDRSIWAFDYAILIDEEFTAAYYEKARTLERMERYAEAAEVYEASFGFDDPTGYSYYRLGNCYRHLGNFNKAYKYFTLAVKEDPELDEALLELSLLNLEQGKIFEAIHYIRKAISLDDDNPDYMIVAIDVYRRAGLYLEAVELYKKVIQS
ncbi:MAG: tetratricopeptide repeat protein, partial [Bacteroidota bacterium]|nr:tetratricopeptide repeat protein [Bacteroidota bacterium]MDX5447828.1 tetratricopeptide repeat protein [Bacteroidota bacterium]MDX5505815.1 tetratricopeptide repeat protein [Bacteroidota bacterium]